MKKLTVLLFALVMAVGFVGMAMAADTVELSTATSGVSVVQFGPMFSSSSTGASAYILTGGVSTWAGKTEFMTGTTLYAVKDQATNGVLSTRVLKYIAGATPMASPQLVSGTSNTVIVSVLAPVNQGVGSSIPTSSGMTLYAINGLNGTEYWSKGIPFNDYLATAGAIGAPFDLTNSGISPYSLSRFTIDNENTSYAGATIYGVAGTGALGGNGNSGLSVFAISAQSGNYSTNASGRSNVTGFVTGVSTIQASPVISGNSVFYLGYSTVRAGISLFQFAKNDIYNGVKASATVNATAVLSDQWIPTPAAAGNTIFVVDNSGGVTAFRADNLAQWYNYRYARGTSGVTAGPVVYGDYLVLCGTNAVTGYTTKPYYRHDAISGLSYMWTYNFGANKTIDSTPAASNGYVWVTVNDRTSYPSVTSTSYRFTIASTTNGAPLQVATYGQETKADPIIVGGNLWTVTNDPVVSKIAADGANGEYYWPQFKFDKAKTGHNTRVIHSADVPGDDGGCFISTVK